MASANEPEIVRDVRIASRLLMGKCVSCGEQMPQNECPKSKRPCGHHCNHSWSHDHCDWCGEDF